MSILNIQKFFKDSHSVEYITDVLIVLIVLIAGFSGFALGQHATPTTTPKATIVHAGVTIPPLVEQGDALLPYVASVNGEKYFPTLCSQANRIKESNRIYFRTVNEAEEAGYTPSVQCDF